MGVKTPQPPTELIPDDVDAGVIEDARARQRRYRRRGAALAAAVIAIGALIVGFSGGGGSGTGQPSSGQSPGTGPSADFRLLRSQRASSLSVPPWVLRDFSISFPHTPPSPEKQFDLNIPAARGTELEGGVRVWLIPGRSGSCFAVSGPGANGAGCSRNDDDVLVTRGFEQDEGYTRNGEKQAIVGIAPDGAHVTFRLSDGSSVPAQLNSYDAYVIVRPISDPVVKTTFTHNGRTITERAPGMGPR